MTDLRGRSFSDLVAGLNAGQHLAVDAVVAFVDGELSASARDRAAEHLTTCETCAAEVAEQRQARSAVRSAHVPHAPAALLAALRDIPRTAELPTAPDGLAVTAQGTVVALADSTASTAPRAPLGSTPPLGSGPRWGTGPAVLGRRIGRSGAGAVVSGLMLGVLAMTVLENPLIDDAGVSSGPPPSTLEPPAPAEPVAEPVAARKAQPAAVVPDRAAMLRMTMSPGWHALHIPR